jgi:hypothetical protein
MNLASRLVSIIAHFTAFYLELSPRWPDGQYLLIVLNDAVRYPNVQSPFWLGVSQLDLVRGIAILSVIEYHAVAVPIQNVWASSFDYVFKRIGWMGVDLFFVLSGFLIGGRLTQGFLKTGDIRIRRFLVRRMFKIWPAYYPFIIFQLWAGRHSWASFAWQNLLNITRCFSLRAFRMKRTDYLGH